MILSFFVLTLSFKALLVFSTSNSSTRVQCIILVAPAKHRGIVGQEVYSEEVHLHLMTSSDFYATIVDFVSTVFHGGNSSCGNVIGVVGDLDSQTASIIHTLASRANLNITLVATSTPSTFLPVTNLYLPHLLDMNPLQHYVDAIASLSHFQKWTENCLVVDDDKYYQYAAEIFHQHLNDSIERVIHFNKQTVDDLKLKLCTMRCVVVYLFMNEASLCSVFQEIESVWPSSVIVWIAFGFKSGLCELNGLLIVEDSHFNKIYDNDTNSFHNHDLVTAVSLVKSRDIWFEASNALLRFLDGKRVSNISIIRIIHDREGVTELIAHYDSESAHLMFASNEDKFPFSSTIVHVECSSVAHTTTILMVTTTCFVFVTLVLIAYIRYRHEKEIKATSFTVSLCMFAGCYLLLVHVYMLLIAYQSASKISIQANLIICNGLAWSSGISLPSTLVLATLLVKMLRVYSIFNDPFSHNKRLFSDFTLLIYIALLTSPTIIILTLWSSLDYLTNSEFRLVENCREFVIESCVGRHTLTWILMQLFYTAILTASVVVVALKSSKIRFKNFQDTKSTNSFVFLTVNLVVATTFYWYFFYRLEPSVVNSRATYITLYCGHNAFVIVCQSFLFVPKIYPPIRRTFLPSS